MVVIDKTIDLLTQLEEDLAAFYERVARLGRFEQARNVFDYMVEHSRLHARAIEGLKKKYPATTVQDAVVIDIMHRIKDTAYERITTGDNFNQLMDDLIETEESVGKMYRGIAGVLRQHADTFREFADRITEIADQEFEHAEKIRQAKK